MIQNFKTEVEPTLVEADLHCVDLQIAYESCCVVVLGGSLPKASYIKELIKQAAFCVAADRGADWALQLGRLPDLLIGDLDSIGAVALAECKQHNVTIKQSPAEKDYTDGELAFFEAAKLNFANYYIVAGVGSRLDHSLGNLAAASGLVKLGKKVSLCYDNCIGYILQGGNPDLAQRLIKGKIGDTVSVLALTDEAVGVNLAGFVYPLVDATLPSSRAWGISNELAAAVGKVSLRQGQILVLHNFWI